ncbi:MAG TPA: hypothetical protein VGL61_15385 [Kofleriaceae bacterium]|jgi:hypothetical protein
MTANGWRRLCIVLAAICVVQTWRACTHAPAAPSATSSDRSRPATAIAFRGTAADDDPAHDDDHAAVPKSGCDDGLDVYGFKLKIPAWAMWLAPQPGEDLLAYRDRIVPLAKAAIAPQRTRVAQARDDFAALAHLDAHQLGELDGATKAAADEIEERVLGAAMNGELTPAMRPMAGVALAHELLDDVDRQNTRFMNALTDDQRAQLATSQFDFGDYLLFATHWEDALGATQ